MRNTIINRNVTYSNILNDENIYSFIIDYLKETVREGEKT